MKTAYRSQNSGCSIGGTARVRLTYTAGQVSILGKYERPISTDFGPCSARSNVMKTVLFCGGLGTRIRDYSENIPKPMIPIGDRPILWHLMQYYSQYGHKDFVLCLGHKANVIKEFFVNH